MAWIERSGRRRKNGKVGELHQMEELKCYNEIINDRNVGWHRRKGGHPRKRRPVLAKHTKCTHPENEYGALRSPGRLYDGVVRTEAASALMANRYGAHNTSPPVCTRARFVYGWCVLVYICLRIYIMYFCLSWTETAMANWMQFNCASPLSVSTSIKYFDNISQH